MGTAVCMVGEPRTLSLACVHRSVRRHLLEPLLESSPHPVSLIMLLRTHAASGIWWEQDRHHPPSEVLELMGTPETQYPGEHTWSLSSNRSLGHALGSLKSVPGLASAAIRWLDTEYGANVTNRCGGSAACSISGGASPSTEGYLAQQVAWEACLTSVEDLERQRGGTPFTSVIRVRPDLWWSSSLPVQVSATLSSRVYLPVRHDMYRRACSDEAPSAVKKPYLMQSDWFVSTPRALAHASLGWLRDFCKTCNEAGSFALEPPPAPQEIVTAEGTLAHRLAPFNATLVPLPASIIRPWSGKVMITSRRHYVDPDVRAMSKFARWSGVSCAELDRDCFSNRLSHSGLGWCTDSTGAGRAHAADSLCAEVRNGSFDRLLTLVASSPFAMHDLQAANPKLFGVLSRMESRDGGAMSWASSIFLQALRNGSVVFRRSAAAGRHVVKDPPERALG
jgi:hypothetical protein